MELLSLVVAGDPIPKGRPRAGRGHHYTPARTREAERRLREVVAEQYTGQPYEGDVGIELVFYCATRRRTDGDNLTKLVTDALQRGKGEHGVFVDDSQILDWRVRVHRRAEGEQPRTEIRVYALES